MPANELALALDDDRDGQADKGKLDEIIHNACTAVDAYLGRRYTVPFNDPPAVVGTAALIFALEEIWGRRVPKDSNPMTSQANYWRQQLERIGNGEMRLTADEKPNVKGVAITEPMSTQESMS